MQTPDGRLCLSSKPDRDGATAADQEMHDTLALLGDLIVASEDQNRDHRISDPLELDSPDADSGMPFWGEDGDDRRRERGSRGTFGSEDGEDRRRERGSRGTFGSEDAEYERDYGKEFDQRDPRAGTDASPAADTRNIGNQAPQRDGRGRRGSRVSPANTMDPIWEAPISPDLPVRVKRGDRRQRQVRRAT